MGWPRSAWGLGRSACLWRDSECRAARDIFGGETPKWVAASRFGVCICMCAAARQGCRLIKRLREYLKRRVYNENEKTQQKKSCTATAHPEVPSRQPPHCAHTDTPQTAGKSPPRATPWHLASRAAASSKQVAAGGRPPPPTHTPTKTAASRQPQLNLNHLHLSKP